MENSCPRSLPFTNITTAAAAARASTAAATHAPPTAITATTSNSDNSSNTDRGAGTTSGNSASIQSSLRQLNKNSYKISKQSSGSVDTGNPGHHRPLPPLPPPATSPPLPSPPPPTSQQPPPPQPQPPVYNIHKNDFRDVVQKLTGSPAHHSRGSSSPAAPAAATPKHALTTAAAGGGTTGGTSSRLQKIRPPPLAQLTPRPLAHAVDSNSLPQTTGDVGGNAAWARPTPLSPLPPFPTVSAAAESPITAYMRCLRSGVVPHQQGLIPSLRGGFSGGALLPPAPSSPLGFVCVPSPQSACQGVLLPGLLLPPSPMPSPRWGDQ